MTFCQKLFLVFFHTLSDGALLRNQAQASVETTHGSSFERAWHALSQDLSWDDRGTRIALRIEGTRQMKNYSQTEEESKAWSNRKYERKDVYSPENPGAETVDEWCSQPLVYDPACSVNPVAVSMEEEINLVMLHMMCRYKRLDGCKASEKNSRTVDTNTRASPDSNGQTDGESKKNAAKEGETGGEAETGSANNKQTTSNGESKKDAPNEGETGGEAENGSADNKQTTSNAPKEAEERTLDSSKDDAAGEEETKDASKQDPANEGNSAEPQAGEDVPDGRFLPTNPFGKRIPDAFDNFRKKVREKFGDSDESFIKFDRDNTGEIGPDEFHDGCALVGVEPTGCRDVFRYMADRHDSKDAGIKEKRYKNQMGVTSCEIARRMQHGFVSVQSAYEAGDADQNGALSKDEFQRQCSKTSPRESCNTFIQELSPGTSFSEEVYKEWMESCASLMPTTISRRVAPTPSTYGSASPAPGESTQMAPAPAASDYVIEAPAPTERARKVSPESASEHVLEDVEKLKNLTETLKQKDKLDPELKGAMDDMIAKGTAAGNTLRDISKVGPKEASDALDDLVDKADALGDAVFKFETEVHPHGYKWWRYRWEYAFVEANLLNILVLATMLLYMLLHWVQTHMATFSLVVHTSGFSVSHLYHMIFWRSMLELVVLGFIAFIIWALEEGGIFVWFAKFLPNHPIPSILDIGSTESLGHWPTTDQHVIYTLRSVNMHLFLAMLLYYLLMYHILLGAISTLQQFMRHETPEFYERFMMQGIECDELREASNELRARSKACHAAFTRKWWLGRSLSSDTAFKAFFGCLHQDEDFFDLRDYVSKQTKNYEGFKELYRLLPLTPLYPYLARRLCTYLEFMIEIDWRVWLLVQCVLVAKTFVHYCFRIAVIEILPFNIAIGICLLIFQYLWTRRRISTIMYQQASADKGKKKKKWSGGKKSMSMGVTPSWNPWYSEGRKSSTFNYSSEASRMGVGSLNAMTMMQSEAPYSSTYTSQTDDAIDEGSLLDRRERLLLYLQQLNFFFLCFAAARLIFSSFFWKDYFLLSCCLLVVFLATYAVFVFLGSLTVPMFIVMLSLPPYMSEQDIEDLKGILEAEHNEGLEDIGETSEEDDVMFPPLDRSPSPSARKERSASARLIP